MKVAYVFTTGGATATHKLGKMILPQLEEGRHGFEVVGMFFFGDNNYVLRKGDPIGERLAKLARKKGFFMLMCDECALDRGLAEGVIGDCKPANTVDGVTVGCFPDLYEALSANPPDQVVSL
jgi:sulfur relay (sulfurtransferase) complex TusBCD TusD component (DsrE family)